jgi:hypothetical protein
MPPGLAYWTGCSNAARGFNARLRALVTHTRTNQLEAPSLRSSSGSLATLAAIRRAAHSFVGVFGGK